MKSVLAMNASMQYLRQGHLFFGPKEGQSGKKLYSLTFLNTKTKNMHMLEAIKKFFCLLSSHLTRNAKYSFRFQFTLKFYQTSQIKRSVFLVWLINFILHW